MTLQNTITDQQAEVVTLIKENALLRESKAHLEEEIAWLKRQIFGKRSEKVVKNLNESQLLFDGFEGAENATPAKKQPVPAHERTKPSRDGKDKITLSPDLPVERQVIDIPEEEKVCPETGKPLVKIGEEVTLKLAHKPGSYFIKEIVRPKYALLKKALAALRLLLYQKAYSQDAKQMKASSLTS